MTLSLNDYTLILSDGTNEVGVVSTDAAGVPTHLVQRQGMPNDALLSSQGESTWSDYDPLYMSIPQDDWSGGRGLNDFDKDTSRYYDGLRTCVESVGLLPGPRETYATGIYTQNVSTHSAYNWVQLTGGTYYACAFTGTGAGGTHWHADWADLKVRKVGTPNGVLTLELWSNNAGNPNAVLKTVTLAVATVTDVTTYDWMADWTADQQIDGTSVYYLSLRGAAADNATNHWEVLCDNSGTVWASANGTVWTTSTTYTPYYRVLPNHDTYAAQFFEYKRATYAVIKYDNNANSALWMNGDRGAADDNTGALTTLVDATKAWTNDEWIGAKVILIDGPGSEETQNWRTITDNAATTLTVDPAWNVVHTTATNYVIVSSNKWTIAHDLGGVVTDVAIADDFVYFARGDTGANNVLRYQEYNNAGAWGHRDVAESIKARNLVAIRHPEDDCMTLYGSYNNSGQILGNVIWKANVPRVWGALYYDLGQLVRTDQPWDEQIIANVTQSTSSGSTKIAVAAAFATGVIASKDFTAVDVTAGKYLGMYMKSSVVTDATNIDMLISSVAVLGGAEHIHLDVPAMATADTVYWHLIDMGTPIKDTTADGNNYKAIISAGLELNADLGAQDITIYFDGVRVVADHPKYIDFPNDARILRLVAYGGDAINPRKNPWVETENGWFEVQTQNDDAVVPLPIEELVSMKDGGNGRASGVNDVYLYFNLGRKFERYYSRNLDDIGPDLDDGLPLERQGDLYSFLSWPGRVFLNIDAGSVTYTGVDTPPVAATRYSSILMLRGNAWHEYFRAPVANRRIRGIGYQVIPGTSMGRLWFAMRGELAWVPVSTNPYTDSEYKFTHEAVLESGWLYGKTKGIAKAWKAITAFIDNVRAGSNEAKVDFKIDNEANAWTAISSTYDASPFEKHNLSTANPPTGITGNRLKYRIRLYYTGQAYSPPLVKALVASCYGIGEIKHGYTMFMKVDDNYQGVNLSYTKIKAGGYNSAVNSLITLLDSWASNLTPLYMTSSAIPWINGKAVLMRDAGVLPRDVQWPLVDERSAMIQITVHDL